MDHRNAQNSICLKEHREKFSNELTDINSIQYDAYYAEFPKDQIAKSYLFMCTGNMFPFLGKSDNNDIKVRAQFQSFSKELKITEGMKPFDSSKEFYYFYWELFKHCKQCKIFLLPWELYDPDENSDIGFVCDDFTQNQNAHLPIKYRGNLLDWSTQIYNTLNKDKILPEFIRKGLRTYENQGYEFLRSRIAEYHPAFMEVSSTVCPSHPVQGMYELFDDYAGNFLYYQ